jgi:phage major head subunit gpT-like protein
MIINAGNLKTLFIAFKAAFQGVLGQAQTQYGLIATTVPSTTGSEEYGWLGSFPSMREWLGDRVINGVKAFGYTIRNKSFELTVGVPRPAIEDDQYGVYTPMMQEMGRATGAHPDELCFGQLKVGASTLCYDGQYFYDTDHPVLDANGVAQSQSNYDDNSGSGTLWHLLDCSRALKPIIFQERKKPNFVAKTSETDDNVFDRAEYVYGVDSRCNVGVGFWQLAYGSRKTLDEAGLIAAYTAMCERKGDFGRPLGIKPTHLVVPPSLEVAARKLVNATTLANGADNVLKGLVTVISSPWLA